MTDKVNKYHYNDANDDYVETKDVNKKPTADTANLGSSTVSSDPVQQQGVNNFVEPKATQKTWDDVYSMLREERDQYKQDDAKLKRRSKAREAIAGISDAAQALANMHFAGQGAGQIYDPRMNMSDKARERYDRAKAELDKNHANNMAYIQQLQAQRNADRSQRLADLNYQLAVKKHELNLQQEQRYNDRLALDAEKAEMKRLSDQNKFDLGMYLASIREKEIDHKISHSAAVLLEKEAKDFALNSKLYTYNSKGELVKVETQNIPAGSSASNSGAVSRQQNDSNNTPPSKRKNSNNTSSSNTPPSRR